MSWYISNLGHDRELGPATAYGRTKSVELGSQEYAAHEPTRGGAGGAAEDRSEWVVFTIVSDNIAHWKSRFTMLFMY